MKIILVHNYYQRPGGEDVVFEQERELLERSGHNILTYCRSNREVEAYPGVKRLALAQRSIWSGDTWRDFGGLLRRENPDLVHIHNTQVMISPSIYSACRQWDVPVVQTFHNYRIACPVGTFFRDGKTCEECLVDGLWRGVLHGCYRNSRPATAAVALMLAVHRLRHTWTDAIDSYIALSQFSRQMFLRAGLPTERMFVKPNFVYPDPGMCANRADYALFVGRLSPEKRVSTILNAWSHLRTRIPLIIVGGGPEDIRLQQEVAIRNLSTIRFRGQLPRSQTLLLIGQARFLIFSSEWYENFPMTIAESFARGVPVICSRMGAMQEIVDDGRTGLHFRAGDSEDLGEKVEWAWHHAERTRAMGMEARQEYESKYTAEKNYPLLMEIYRHAMARHPVLKVEAGEPNSLR